MSAFASETINTIRSAKESGTLTEEQAEIAMKKLEELVSSANNVDDNCKMIELQCKDGVSVMVKLNIAKMSVMIDTIVELNEEDYMEDIDDSQIPLPNVAKRELDKIIKFCTYYIENPFQEIQKPIKSSDMKEIIQCPDDIRDREKRNRVSNWYSTFSNMPDEELFALMMAANYLDIPPLLSFVCAATACIIKGKSTNELRERFGIENDFTPEEEAQIREEQSWCVEN